MSGIVDPRSAYDKLDALTRLVVDDLRDEMTSIVNVLVREGISYYLDLDDKKVTVRVGTRFLNDLRDLVIYDDIIAAPSASKLLEIILATVASLSGFSLKKNGDPHLQPTELRTHNTIKKEINEFLKEIERKVLTERPGHLGLVQLIQECREWSDHISDEKSLRKFAQDVNDRYRVHYQARQNIRHEAKVLFSTDPNLKHIMDQTDVNVLLYGFSELVTKAVCGLRDALIETQYPHVDVTMTRNSKYELDASKKINIFICEGQPKTQTGYGDHLTYHDGAEYALHLKRRKFDNIGIMPDAIAGTMISRARIDCILVGADGVAKDYFTHSAGHLTIVELARSHKNADTSSKLAIILVTSQEKVASDRDADPVQSMPYDDRKLREVEGCLFRSLPEYPLNRNRVWICRDRQKLGSLHNEGVFFVNPREDKIPIGKVDYIVSDVGCSPVTPDNEGSVINKLFFRAQARSGNKERAARKQIRKRR